MVQLLNLSEFEQTWKSHPGKILDVRTPAEYQAGHLEGAQNIDWLGGRVQAESDSMDKNETYYLYCASGNRSGMAANYLKQQGFKNVYNIGGYVSIMHADL